MKKAFILLTLLISTFACSTSDNEKTVEQENITKEVGKSDPRVQLYLNYVSSDEFIQVKLKSKNFIKKFIHNDSEFSAIDLENFDMDNFIENNIENSDFQDINQAKFEWGEIVNLNKLVVNNHKELFEQITIDPSFIGAIEFPYTRPEPTPVTTSGCIETCDSTSQACHKASDQRYLQNCRSANAMYDWDDSNLYEAHAAALALLLIEGAICTGNYFGCISSC